LKLKNRYLQIARVIKNLSKRKSKDSDNIRRFLIEFLQAPHFIVELDPATTINEVIEDKTGLENFFAFPYQKFILDFPSLPNVRENFTPFLFCRLLDDHTIYVEDITVMQDVDETAWINQYMQP